MAKVVGQIVHDCGRIANVKAQETGSKIHFVHCERCGLGARSKVESEKVKAAMTPGVNSIGTYGELFKKTADIEESQEFEHSEISLENSETDLEKKSENQDEEWQPGEDPQPAPEPESSENNLMLKIGGGVLLLGLTALGFNAYNNSKNIQ